MKVETLFCLTADGSHVSWGYRDVATETVILGFDTPEQALAAARVLGAVEHVCGWGTMCTHSGEESCAKAPQ